MKPYGILTLMIVVMQSLTGCITTPKVLSEIERYPRSETLRVTPLTMFFMKGAMPGPAGKLIKGMKSVETYDCEDTVSFSLIDRDVDKIIEQKGLELYIESREGRESSRIYGSEPGKNGTVSELFIVDKEPGDYSVVYLKGKMKLGEFITAQLNKKD